jgi:hypothetical protein
MALSRAGCLGPVEQRVDAGDRLHRGRQAVAEHRLLAVEHADVLAGEEAGEDGVVRLAHDAGAVFVEAEVAAALGHDGAERGVVQVVGVDEGAVEVEQQRQRHARARCGRAVIAPV